MEHEAYLEMAAVEARHWWFRGRRKILQAAIKRLNLKPGARILELGSGTGGNFAMLSAFGEVTAVEMNQAAREISVDKPGSASVLAGALPYELPFGAAQKFDLICLFDVLEHVADDAAALAVVRAHLAPGGAGVITVPAYKALFGPHDAALHHKRRYEYAELAAKLSASGLVAERLCFFNTLLAPVAVALRRLDQALGRAQATGGGMPPRPVNAVLAAIFCAEALLPPAIRPPFGLSLLAVVRAVD